MNERDMKLLIELWTGEKIVERAEGYPVWCCSDCGLAASGGKTRGPYATYHMAICDVCGLHKNVTEPRDFCYPDFSKVRANGVAKPETGSADAESQDVCPY